jgi:DNA-directed RNA polymerase specialized sigma subunit
MRGNRYENAYKLHTEAGVSSFLNDYSKLAEARFYASDLSISDMLLDFHFAYKRALTKRQQEVIALTFFEDKRQQDVADILGLTQQTVQEHIQKAIKNLSTYHMLEVRRAFD